MNPIVLGALYNQTGGQAELDIPSSRGAQLAVDQINAAGGVMGRLVELVLVDGATDPAVLAQQTSALIAENPTTSALFGLSDTDMVLAAASSCAAEGRLFVTSGATSPLLPEQVPTYLYLACFGDNVQAAAAAEYAINELDARTALVIYRREDTFTELLQGYFTASYTASGGRVVDTWGYTELDDLSPRLANVTPADIIYFSAAPDDVIAGITRLRDAGHTAPILGGDSFDLGQTWEAYRNLSNIVFTTHALVGRANPDPAMTAFAAAYEQAYPGDEAGAFAALGYDTARLILQVIADSGTSDPLALVEAFGRVRGFAGLTGSISYEGGRRVPTKSVTLLSVAHGQTALAAQFAPQQVPQP